MRARLLQAALRFLDNAARALPWSRRRHAATHLRTGRRGEEDAYFWLRRQGYVIVARNWRSPRRRGELDLVAWENEVLCFVEVKTRERRDLVTAEAAVDNAKQQELLAMGAEYLRRLPAPAPPYRFDVVTVYYEAGRRPAIDLTRNAFAAAG
jgi:putative endonuclease